jgi:hypothetical protein
MTQCREPSAPASLPPRRGGVGRGVAAGVEFGAPPLPVPPPQGEREPWGAAGMHHLRRVFP